MTGLFCLCISLQFASSLEALRSFVCSFAICMHVDCWANCNLPAEVLCAFVGIWFVCVAMCSVETDCSLQAFAVRAFIHCHLVCDVCFLG